MKNLFAFIIGLLLAASTALQAQELNAQVNVQKSIEIELPPESRMAGLIIIEYLKFSPSPDENGYRSRKASVTDCIHLVI